MQQEMCTRGWGGVGQVSSAWRLSGVRRACANGAGLRDAMPTGTYKQACGYAANHHKATFYSPDWRSPTLVLYSSEPTGCARPKLGIFGYPFEKTVTTGSKMAAQLAARLSRDNEAPGGRAHPSMEKCASAIGMFAGGRTWKLWLAGCRPSGSNALH